MFVFVTVHTCEWLRQKRVKKVAFLTHGSNPQENILHMQYVREHETRITLLIVVFMVKRIAGKNM